MAAIPPQRIARQMAELLYGTGMWVGGCCTPRVRDIDLGRAQIIALDILDHLRVSIRQAQFTNECGYLTQSRALRSAVPARTHRDDVPSILTGTAKNDGLQHAMLANGLRQLLQFLFAEVAAWLIGVFVNAVDSDRERSPGCGGGVCSGVDEFLKAEIERH
jgi:hypothetical protein